MVSDEDTKRCSNDPPNSGFFGINACATVVAEAVVVVVVDSAVGWSLICPGLGSSNSSTRPRPGDSKLAMAGTALALAADVDNNIGEVGGLLLCDRRRASSCKNGIGEKTGVAGADDAGVDVTIMLDDGFMRSSGGRGGNADCEVVTNTTLSKARRYFPR